MLHYFALFPVSSTGFWRFLNPCLENIEHWEEYLKQTVSETGIGKPVLSLDISATMKDAFKLIVEKTEGTIAVTKDSLLAGYLSIHAILDFFDGIFSHSRGRSDKFSSSWLQEIF